MHNSVHLLRWVRMIAAPDTVIVVFSVYIADPMTTEGIPSIGLSEMHSALAPGVYMVRVGDISGPGRLIRDRLRGYRPWKHSFLGMTIMASPVRLEECIRRFQPHLIHSMEVQLAGYLCLETARRMGRQFPRWLLSNWGSDIALFRKLPEHQARLRAVCARMDFYLAECARDRAVARALGYRGPDLPIVPASGGAEINALSAMVEKPPSRRRTILVKGYHGWSGRSLLVLSAIQLARDALRGFAIRVPLGSPLIEEWARRLRESGLDVACEPYVQNHLDAFRRLADARIMVGVGISDGISTTLLEAMVAGAFPIQASSACADEWIECGRTGYIVSPYDTRELATRLARAATDDNLVDAAAPSNHAVAAVRWDIARNAETVRGIYATAIATAGH